MKRAFAVVCVLLAAGIAAWVAVRESAGGGAGVGSRGPGEPIARHRRSILLITTDTTRPDRLEPYGATNVATPSLERLAESGIVFENAYSVAPITLVAHTSINTGLYPYQHGVRNNGLQHVPPSVTTLAERLSARGFRTAAFVSAAVLDKRYGLDQGFEVYDDDLSTGRDRSPRQVADRPAEATVAAATEWLGTLKPGEPFFLWVHFYDPHAAYSPPPPFRDDYRERLYDGEIAYMDSQIGMLLKHPALRNDDVATLVVGDHGESLGEHGESTHAILLYDSTVHVPMILRIPGGPRGLRITENVGQVDIVPTLLSLIDVPGGEELAGRDLLPLLEGRGGDEARTYYSETYLPYYTYGWAKLKAVHSGRQKYIEAPTEELFDLHRDPRELTNIATQQPGSLHDLQRDLKGMLSSVEDPEAETDLSLDREAAEQLRSLGYLAVGSAPRQVANRPNPKDLIDLHVSLERARVLAQDRLFEQAEAELQKVLRRDPENLAAMIDLIGVYQGMDRLDDALRIAERGLSLDPNYARLHLLLSNIELRRGYPEKALELLDARAKKDEDDPDMAAQRALVLLRLGRQDELRATLEAALEKSPEHARLNILQAQFVEARSGELDRAVARLRSLLARDPFQAQAWGVLGRLEEQRRRFDEAVAAYRSGLERSPDDGELHGSLGLLLARRGERVEAESQLREAVRLANGFRAELHVSLGALLAESGRYQEAKQEYEKVLAVEPANAGARNNLAIARFRAGDAEGARADLLRLTSEFPRHADAFNNLAAIAVERGEWKEAERYARRTLELAPELTEAWNNLGVALEQEDDLAGGRRAYEKALALDPEYWQARLNLGILLRKSGRSEDALREIEAVLAVAPQQPDVHYELGALYAGPLHDPARARTHWNAFLRYSPPGHPQRAEVRQKILDLPPG
ncbi:MAG: tetratricopeptide repeat protein [Thermoanaerobaculia bacterium]